jgi:hypothetical protein
MIYASLSGIGKKSRREEIKQEPPQERRGGEQEQGGGVRLGVKQYSGAWDGQASRWRTQPQQCKQCTTLKQR